MCIVAGCGIMRILGIETSCDDTAVAVYDGGPRGAGLLAHRLSSQQHTHEPHGGVVPELAARDHIRALPPLVEATLAAAGCGVGSLDGVGYTAGPGLAGALLVGASFGRSLALARDLPALGVHHMEAHLLAPMLEDDAPAYPFIALLVSGGHTMLVDVAAPGVYRLLGRTLDDAVGEAFDKTARLLGLGFPGGPAIASAAASGDPERFRFPRPMMGRPGLDFSYSGLKTFARSTVQKHGLAPQTVADIARAFQDAAVDSLLGKCLRALKQSGRKRLVVAGGVGANKELRRRLRDGVAGGCRVFYPRPEFCTDNGAMIAYAAWLRLRGGFREPLSFEVRPRWPLDDLEPIPAAD